MAWLQERKLFSVINQQLQKKKGTWDESRSLKTKQKQMVKSFKKRNDRDANMSKTDEQIKKENQQIIDTLKSLKCANQKPGNRRNKHQPNTANQRATYDLFHKGRTC
jgi:hypothetical protein